MKIDPKHISTLMATDAETTAGLADKVDKITGKGLSTNDYTTVEQTKLSNIAEGATANSTDAILLDRANHTGNETELTFSEGITPSTPVLGLKTFARQITGRNMFGQIGKSGVDYSFQPLIARNKITLWQSNGNATTSTVIGNAISTLGTATSRTVATTNIFTWFRRMAYVSAGTANSSCGIRTAAIQYGLGNIAGVGGFHFITRCGISDAAAVANSRNFIGLTSTTAAIGNVNPSTLLNIIGFGSDSADTNLQVMHNAGTGTATKIDLGANFPANTRSTDMYEFSLYCPPNSTTVNYQVINLTTGNIANGVISTNLPANTQLLAMQLWRHNGGTASAVALDIVSMYIETDN